MKLKGLLITLTWSLWCWSIQVICLPGLGLDERAFELIDFPGHCSVDMVSAPIPKWNEDMGSYSKRIYRSIDIRDDSVAILGVSFGGMVAMELAGLLTDTLEVVVIQISSCKSATGIPWYYKSLKGVPLHYLVRGSMMECIAPLAARGDMDKQVETLYKDMIYNYSEVRFRRSTSMILNWNSVESSTRVISIHGSRDGVLPVKHLGYVPDYIMGGAKHNLLFTHTTELEKVLTEVL